MSQRFPLANRLEGQPQGGLAQWCRHSGLFGNVHEVAQFDGAKLWMLLAQKTLNAEQISGVEFEKRLEVNYELILEDC